MDQNFLKNLLILRYIIGYLGEKDQHKWWNSNFIAPSTKKMLEYIFPRSTHVAQYEGVSAAAAKIHDEMIGVGKSFHLFRLPEYIEKELWSKVQSGEFHDELDRIVSSQENSMKYLSSYASDSKVRGEGPVHLGKILDSDPNKAIGEIASVYLKAFKKNLKAYPYMDMSGQDG